MIQLLVVAITVLHGLTEYAEERQELTGFLTGLHGVPVEAYILPVVLAGLWYGLEGGLMTGLLVAVLSTPNFFVFHDSEYEWLGEGLAAAFVLGVGILVAVMVEREATSRAKAEATSSRLESLHAVTAALNRQDDSGGMVVAVVHQLATLASVRCAAFVPAEGIMAAGPVVSGHRQGCRRLAQLAEGVWALPEVPVQWPASVVAQEVRAGQTYLGTLYVDCVDETSLGRERALLAHVASELAVAVHNVRLQEKERTELRHYARMVTVAQEKERRRLARDLHDGAAQSLIILSRGLGRLTEACRDEPAMTEAARELHEEARRTLQSIRRTTWALRPALLDDLGLAPAIESLADHQSRRNGVDIDVVVEGEPRRLDREVEVAAFRIAQEALANVERHSQASRATVAIEFHPKRLRLVVADEGIGFDFRAQGVHDRFGLTGMRERAELVDGTLRVDSRPGQGTAVTFEVAD